MSDENRRFSRIGFWGGGKIVVEGKSYLIDKIDNLSVGGCHFELVNDFSKGTSCSVKMYLAEGLVTVSAEAEVIWTDGKAVGLSFVSVEPEDLVHLKKIIRYNAPDTDRIEQEMQDHPGIK